MPRPLFTLLLGCILVTACDSRRSFEEAQLARFPKGEIVEDLENPRTNAMRGLPEILRAQVPVIGRGVCVPLAIARPDGAHDAPRFGLWTYEYVKAEQTTSPDGKVTTHFRDIEETSLGLESRGEYVDNRKEGPWTFWYPSGEKRAAGCFKHDEMSGLWQFWSEDGSVDALHTGIYEHDVLQATPSPK